MSSSLGWVAEPGLPAWTDPRPAGDWMLAAKHDQARLYADPERDGLVLSNGIVARTWGFPSGLGCTSLKHLGTGTEFLRAVRPEAVLTIDGREVAVGGAQGQPDQAFLDSRWLKTMQPLKGSLRMTGFDRFDLAGRMDWKPLAARYREVTGKTLGPGPVRAWPPRGSGVRFTYEGDGENKGIRVFVEYELYDGLPVFSKRIVVHNMTSRTVRIDGFKAEVLATVETESSVDSQDQWRRPDLTVTTDYTFAGMAMGASNRAVRWVEDPSYTTQVNYQLKTPCLLEVAAPVGPGVDVPAGETFASFRVFELLHDSTDHERTSLQVRRMYRSLAPWVLENPIMLHLTSSEPTVVKAAIDQASECGFELVVISFWSGLDMEDESAANISKWKSLVGYAHTKGLLLGGYSLLASRSVNAETDVVDPKTGKPGGAVFGSSPCLGSKWGAEYFRKLRAFIEKTGFDLLEHDGSYPGDVCASTGHPGHRGLEDSQWTQYQTIAAFYRWCRSQGVFLNVPDNYHLAGSNKTGMGYRESNWSLPRALQHVHARQNLFDGTWEKTPSMGWMMVPLVEYQGGGKEATIEPLHEHLADYRMHLVNNFAFGAQACYRGPRLFDSPEVKAMVVEQVQWFKEHREVLESDIVHVRRATGRGIDAVLHVNPNGNVKAMLVAWNPLTTPVSEDLIVPLYFSGLSKSAKLRASNGKSSKVTIDGAGHGTVHVTVPAGGFAWWVFE